MRKNIKISLALVALLCTSGVQAQVTGSAPPTTGTTTTSPTGVSPGINPGQGTMPTTGTTGASGVVLDTQSQNILNAQSTEANRVQANPAQPSQQNTGGGVFGPSAGPGIFGPTSTAVTTDIYGNQQPVSGTVQPSQQSVPVTGAGVRTQQLRSQTPITYDANGQATQNNNLSPQSTLPQPINPITPSGTGQTQPTPGSINSGTVTGR